MDVSSALGSLFAEDSQLFFETGRQVDSITFDEQIMTKEMQSVQTFTIFYFLLLVLDVYQFEYLFE